MKKTQEKVLTYPKQKLLILSGFAILSVFTILLSHQQWITGPIINAILISATLTLGPWEAIALAFLPSGIALSTGLLPAALLPVLPAIIFGNIILISTVQILRNKPITGVITGAIAKFIWLTIASTWILHFFVPFNFWDKSATMLSWPQLATALLGGAIALSALKIRKQNS